MPEHEKIPECSLSEFAFTQEDEAMQDPGFIPVQALAKALEPFGFGLSKRPDGKPLYKPHFIEPANKEIVSKLHNLTWDNDFAGFEYRVDLDATTRERLNTKFSALYFAANFIDRGNFEVVCTNSDDDMQEVPRSRALVSLLYNQRFRGVEAFAVACHNALGEDIDSVLLEGRVSKISHSNPSMNEVVV